ncbi:DNA-binding protein [Schaalia turicensis]|uniref:helix-turn-helix domain-containing transcriptional regulator n=1 Tax=Schaalia turicensis TaxID=131111 RepID=UPI0036AA8371
MGTINFSTFSASKYLDSQEAIDDYLAIARADGDAATMQLVLRDIARARTRIQQAPQSVRPEPRGS